MSRDDKDALRSAAEFLRKSHLYHLGDLPTEAPHPDTDSLSSWAQENLQHGVSVLKQVDLKALRSLQGREEEFAELAEAIQETWSHGGRVFLCGCGATGRLSLSLEYLWRRYCPQKSKDQSVLSFMAGGDVALVHALEGFEDYPEYGAKHLREMGFQEQDLLIASTEGGETPFVIGATLEAAKISKHSPYFLYCNPRDLLVRRVERSKEVLEHPDVRSLNLYVGAMALTGSTRMQASTVQMLVIGLALFKGGKASEMATALDNFINYYESLDLAGLAEFVRAESNVYEQGHRVIYHADEFAITVMTDTTERAPTFSLTPFDNQRHPRERHSLCYMMIPESSGPMEAWQHLLGRSPHCLDWQGVDPRTSEEYLKGFDFSQGAKAFRHRILPKAHHVPFQVMGGDRTLCWSFHEIESKWPRSSEPLFDHLALKMMLNIHSTLVMGRLDRYVNNLMTWVYPTNGKLIDRAARYVLRLLTERGFNQVSYKTVIEQIFVELPRLKEGQSVVLKVVESLSK